MRPPELASALAALDALPPDRPGRVFREPWHAQAFALTVALHGQGRFSWPEWAAALARALDEQASTADAEDAYYAAWLRALERLAAEKGLIDATERERREAAWAEAARATPHGQPILLRSAHRGSA